MKMRSILLFALFFICNLFGTMYACPTQCYCSDTTMTCENVDMTESDLSSLEIPDGITELVLKSNNLESISESSMFHLRRLKTLEISKNKLKKIPIYVFRGFSNLRKLVLNENEIIEIDEGSFIGLNNLVYLEMQFNKIAHLQEGVFDELRSIYSILLQDNKLLTVGNNVFNTLPKLKHLALTRNEIVTIQSHAFKGMRLKMLGLASNKIRVIPENAFEDFDITRKINMLDNPLDCSCRNAMNYKVNFKLKYKFWAYCATPYHVDAHIMDAHEELDDCSLCDLDPCKNEGKCVGNKETFTCECQERFKGKYCQTNVCEGYTYGTEKPVVEVNKPPPQPLSPNMVALKRQNNRTEYIIVKEHIPNEDDAKKLKILYAMCAFEFIVIICFVVYFMWKRYEEYKLQKRYENDKNRAILLRLGDGTNEQKSQIAKVLVEENEDFPPDLKHMILTGSVPV
ncbi:leucine-rich repeat-containing protein 70-like [Clytia hemisphaerica]|uniref:EGF-like domain-containing protein n=1 Tax=Clytia hemisphaerica TaxID=252671 RepID=A0A7M5TX80_9CNID|eukprot:TCONS_00030314-protein